LKRSILATGITCCALWAVSLICSAPAEAGSYKGFPSGYCTWYAAQEFDRVALRPGVNWSGNAGDWIPNAVNAGWRYFDRVNIAGWYCPSGTIVVWKDGGFGHVAIVREVTWTGITIDEMNWGTRMVDAANGKTDRFGQVNRRFLTWAQVLVRGSRNQYRFAAYIVPSRWR
jgi:surface antigen